MTAKKATFFYVIYYLAYSSIYIARMNFSVVSALLESAGTLNKTQIGWIGSIFALTYAGMMLPRRPSTAGTTLPARSLTVPITFSKSILATMSFTTAMIFATGML